MNAELARGPRLLDLPEPVTAPDAGLWARMARGIEHLRLWRAVRRRYRRTVRELERLSDRDLADIGLSRGEVRAMAQRLARLEPAA